MAASNYVVMELPNPVIRAQSTVDFPIGGHVNVLSNYKETVNCNFNSHYSHVTDMLIQFFSSKKHI